MTTVACDQCKARLGLPDAPPAPAGATAPTQCGYCGGPLGPASGVEGVPQAPEALTEPASGGLLDELLTRAPRASTPPERKAPPKPNKSKLPPPPAQEPTTAPLVELLSVRGKDSNSGRQVPFESGVALNLALEPAIALEATHGPSLGDRDGGRDRKSEPSSALEAVSALPSVTSRPPRGLVQTVVKLPPSPKGPRDSLDDGWETSASAPPPPAASPRPLEARPLPSIGLPEEILAGDALAAPSRPPALDDSRADEPRAEEVAEELASAPSAPRIEPLHDAVTFEASQVSAVFNEAAVAAALPPAWSSRPFAVLGAETPRSKRAGGVVRRFAPWIGGAVAVLGVIALAIGLSGKKQEAPHAAAAAAPIEAPPAREAARNAPPPEPAAPSRPSTAPDAAPESLSTGDEAGAKSTFNNKAANISLARAITRAKACKKPKDAASSALAIVTFAPSGNVVAANVSGKKVSGTPLAACVSRAMKGARVPPFRGEAVTMKKTVQFK